MMLESRLANWGNKLSAGGQLEQPSDVKSSSRTTGAYEPYTDRFSCGNNIPTGFFLTIKPRPANDRVKISIEKPFITLSYEVNGSFRFLAPDNGEGSETI